MATSITVTRASASSSIDAVRQDDAIWQVSQEIEGYLATRNIQQVVAEDIRALLDAAHGDVQMVEDNYVYGVDVVPGIGPMPYCIKTHTISVREQPSDEPVVVKFEVTATYS